MIRFVTFLILLVCLSVMPLVSGTEDEPKIKVDSIEISFLHTFSVDTPLYQRLPFDKIDQSSDYTSFFRFNDSFKKSIAESPGQLNASGALNIRDTHIENILFELKNSPGLFIIINPSYINIIKQIPRSELTKDEYRKIYNDFRSFVYETFSDNSLCFDNPPGFYGRYYERRFCPLLKQNTDYQRDRWTILIEFRELAPAINESNKNHFEEFHLFSYPRDVKEAGPLLNNNYIFYDIREDESVIVSFNPKGRSLENYLVLTELIFASAEQDNAEIKRSITEVNREIERYQDKIYLENDDKILKEIKKNLARMNIDNLTKSEKLIGLEALGKLENKLIHSTESEKEDEIYPLLYDEKIRSHYDSFSDDLEQLSGKYEDIKSKYADVGKFVDSRLQYVEQMQSNRQQFSDQMERMEREINIAKIGVAIAIIFGVISMYFTRKEINQQISESEKQTKTMEELIQSSKDIGEKIVNKLDELKQSTRKE